MVGQGRAAFGRAADAVLRWEVKTRSGFRVPDGDTPVRPGQRYRIRAGIGPVRVVEPVTVVAVVTRPDRVGFAYGTESGHPVSGEEAFVVSCDDRDRVVLSIRSVTRPAPERRWRLLFPVLLGLQRVARRRYLRALLDP